jgi:hypothetical protein
MQYAAAPRSWHELHDSHTPLLSALTSGYSTLRLMSLAALVLHIWRYIVLHANGACTAATFSHTPALCAHACLS